MGKGSYFLFFAILFLLAGCGSGDSTSDSRLTLGFGVSQSYLVPYSSTAPKTCTEKYGSVALFADNLDGLGSSVGPRNFEMSPMESSLSYSAKFSYPTITWASTNSTVEIILITFKVKNLNINGGQEYTSVIESSELGTMYARSFASNGDGTYTATDPWSPQKLPWYSSASPTTAVYSKSPYAGCTSFVINGISLSNKKAFVANGTFEVIGVETITETGVQKPVKTSVTVTVESVGI